MQTTIETADKLMTVYLSGELDHHNAPTVRDKIDETAARFGFRRRDVHGQLRDRACHGAV